MLTQSDLSPDISHPPTLNFSTSSGIVNPLALNHKQSGTIYIHARGA
ncbi:hypothetical protein IQ259_20850 [Fortiea sp. LEGE XX443]|nr:hypothetical protein [Fortiea sp. LEGE XX443]MBE9007447.1 hypothetical protein [Fortiea sp. LEGE XX443]